jgi:hypothetical protein
VNYDLPEIVMMRGVPVRKQREGDMVRIVAGPLNTTCPPRDVWEITTLLVDAAEKKTTCPRCGRS